MSEKKLNDPKIEQNQKVIDSFKKYHNLETNTGRRTTFNAKVKYEKKYGKILEINSDIIIDESFNYGQYEVTICKLCGDYGEFHPSFNTNFQEFSLKEGCLYIEQQEKQYNVTIELNNH